MSCKGAGIHIWDRRHNEPGWGRKKYRLIFLFYIFGSAAGGKFVEKWTSMQSFPCKNDIRGARIRAVCCERPDNITQHL